MKLPKIVLSDTEANIMHIEKEALMSISMDDGRLSIDNLSDAIVPKIGGIFDHKCLYLANDYDYLLGEDETGHPSLFILRKGTLDHADT